MKFQKLRLLNFIICIIKLFHTQLNSWFFVLPLFSKKFDNFFAIMGEGFYIQHKHIGSNKGESGYSLYSCKKQIT